MLSKSEKIKRCAGCHYNRYNQPKGYREDAHSFSVSGEGCWNLRTAHSANLLLWLHPGDYKRQLRLNTLHCWHTICFGEEVTKTGIPKRKKK